MTDHITVTVPGRLVDHVQDADDPEIRKALDSGRRGLSGWVRVTAPAATHELILDRCWVFGSDPGVAENADTDPAERAAYRRYETGIARAMGLLPGRG